MKPVLFLDIDGVLNTFGSQPEGGILRIQQDKVRRLKRILDTVPCDVVLSSTWRILECRFKEASEMIANIGYRFYSLTPKYREIPGSILVAASGRSAEIKQWLNLNPTRTEFVVLDDDVFPADFPDANQVHTDGFDGALTEEKADEVIRKLKAFSHPATNPTR